MTACIVLSAGWAVAALAAFVLWLAIHADLQRVGLAAFLLFSAGLVSCAVEDRVCEFAERSCES